MTVDEKSKNHICYCDRVDGTMVRTSKPSDSSFEFYVTDDGVTLMRRQLGQVGEKDVACLTGGWNIEEFCKGKGCKVPDATARLLQVQQAAAQPGGQSSTNDQKGRAMKSENGKSVAQVWEELFVANESRKDKWTDEQLADEFKKQFPASKGEPRPAMFRSCYNAGTYMYEKAGKPDKRGLPESHRYDEQGREILPGKRKAVVDNETGDPDLVPLSRLMKKNAAKGKGKGAKKVAKKASSKKKVVVRRKSK